MKKRISLILASVMAMTTLFAGCSPSNTSTETTTAAPATTTAAPATTTAAPANTTAAPASKQFSVGLVSDQGGINDKSFNQAANTGLEQAVKEFGITKKVIESKQQEEYEQNLQAFVTQKADLIVGVGYMMQDALTNVSKQNPDSKFLFIDGVVDNPNVLSVTFKENEGSYLMGVIAAKMSKTGKVGFIGGMDGELIQRFESGFAAGVMSVDKNAGALLADRTLVKYAGSFDDAQKGKELANSLIDVGCDVIYHAAGGVGIGMFDAVQAARSAGKDVWAIGVDMDQSVTLPQYAPFILSSCMKRVDTATYDAAKDLVNGALTTGVHKELGLKEDGVGIAPTTNKNVPQDVLDLVTKYQNAIISGQIVVPATLDQLKSFTVPTI